MTFPLWGWFKTPLKNKWLAFSERRMAQATIETLPRHQEASYWRMGLLFALMMFCVMSLPNIIAGQTDIRFILTEIGIWLVSGGIFGGAMKYIMGKKNDKY
ncbi:hypothetical protein [Thalassotalea euphylliae]|uniref:hypothetical protein n=1 Tax=Thalassotalea euphylliae TaxID=1655234 RepID=UPI0011C0385B|nr:hypothetical protein [Thalassotalea euphylliae]